MMYFPSSGVLGRPHVVLRHWNGGLDLGNPQIAAGVGPIAKCGGLMSAIRPVNSCNWARNAIGRTSRNMVIIHSWLNHQRVLFYHGWVVQKLYFVVSGVEDGSYLKKLLVSLPGPIFESVRWDTSWPELMSR